MPAGTPRYFPYPFGVNGDLTAIPDPTQGSGAVSYNIGFGPDYALINTDPSSLTIPRNQFNQLMFDITSTLQQLYQNGFPLFITSAMNDGSPFSYSKNSYVYQPSDGNVYYSLVNSNTDVPPTSNWQLINGVSVDLYINYAADTGSANIYLVAPNPAITSYVAGQVLTFSPTNANTGASTIAINGLLAKAIKTQANTDPVASAMIPSGFYFLVYNGTNFVLTNPTTSAATGFTKINEQVFSSNGTYTPTAGMIYCRVRAVAGGGGGGGEQSNNFGGGAGGGEYAEAVFSAATIGASKAVTIGLGGAGGLAAGGGGNDDGNDGGDTSLGSLLIAKGGKKGGGAQHSGGGAGAGGTGGTGAVLIDGQPGSNGVASRGGNSLFGYGGVPSPTMVFDGTSGWSFSSGVGAAGTGYGGGGSGAWNNAVHSANGAGGDGSGGYMIIEEFGS